MITDMILDVFIMPTHWLMDAIPQINLPVVGQDTLQYFASMIHSVGVMIPFDQLMPIFLAELAIAGFNITWSIVLRIKSFVPTMGH